jgi:hypothetical protein
MDVNDKMQVLNPGKQAHCGGFHQLLPARSQVWLITAKTRARLEPSADLNTTRPRRLTKPPDSESSSDHGLSHNAPELSALTLDSFWKPLHHPAKDNTLALCDGSTIDAADLVEADHISTTYLGSTMYGLYSPNHKWYYLRHHAPDEIFMFKIFDSDPNVAAKCKFSVPCRKRLPSCLLA